MELTLNLNARLQPMHRHILEDKLQEILEKEKLGEVTGGGTLQSSKGGEIVSCDIEIHLNNSSLNNIDRLAELTNQLGIPKGSALLSTESKIKVGTLEGLAYYSNGTELTDEVYENCDINHVIEQMETAMEGIGRFYSYWEADEWTALYFYGTSFFEMKKRIEPFITSYPLCQKSRIEQIA
ncbi:hypothetical protein [Coprobacter tertius]|uniref:Uncharacterized protein n=1 Tax=Coprobacter tertius TaxID=2944915 RepID=A0ABT1MJW9_9BACT|nr:hypothetical protein [Coprobacter tertius]MCP9612161.1 hypothetical protein [Coprobacter tertius]